MRLLPFFLLTLLAAGSLLGCTSEPPVSPCPVCASGFVCRFTSCVREPSPCEQNLDCLGDTYCAARLSEDGEPLPAPDGGLEGECIPYDVPEDVINDTECQRVEPDGSRSSDLPDFTVEVLELEGTCNSMMPTTVELGARVCNRGTEVAPAEVRVDFEERGQAIDDILCGVSLRLRLAPGRCEEVRCTGLLSDVDALVVSIDTDATVEECRTDNNVAEAGVVCFN